MSSASAWKAHRTKSRKAALSTKAGPETPLPPTTSRGTGDRHLRAEVQSSRADPSRDPACGVQECPVGRKPRASLLCAGRARDPDRLWEDHPEVFRLGGGEAGQCVAAPLPPGEDRFQVLAPPLRDDHIRPAKRCALTAIPWDPTSLERSSRRMRSPYRGSTMVRRRGIGRAAGLRGNSLREGRTRPTQPARDIIEGRHRAIRTTRSPPFLSLSGRCRYSRPAEGSGRRRSRPAGSGRSARSDPV